MSRATLAERWSRDHPVFEIEPAKAEKYSPDEPRDDHGRWTTGGEFAEMPLPADYGKPENEQAVRLRDAETAWQTVDGSSEMRALLAGRYSTSTPEYRGPGLHTPDEVDRAADLLLDKVNSSAPTTADMYRGITVQPADLAALRDAIQPGKTIDLNLSSWTPLRGVGEDFAANEYGTGVRYGRGVLFDLAPGAHVYGIQNFLPMTDFAQEHLTAGRFRVDNVERAASDGDWPGRPYDTIHLTQVGTLTADQISGSHAKVAHVEGPAVLLRWLEPYMEQRMVPPKEGHPNA